jgi:diketogulonate reductase-like aldo/keto reductase
MFRHIFGSTGRDVPVIGQGSWQFPREKKAVAEAQKALRVGLELGMVHIDTAEMYGDSELVIGDVIKDFSRKELFIVSKVLPSNSSFKGTIQACERSLKRLGTDYLDCYLLHWRGSIPLSETIGAFEQLVDEGKILSLGVSNFDLDDMKEAVSLAKRHKIACNQVLYNLYERGIERKLVPYCMKQEVAIVAYTPFGQRKIPGRDTKSGAVLHEIAEKHKATPAQIVLAFLVREDGLFTIPKASQVQHTIENARAGDIILDEEDIDEIDRAFPAPDYDAPLSMI